MGWWCLDKAVLAGTQDTTSNAPLPHMNWRTDACIHEGGTSYTIQTLLVNN